MDIFSHGLWSVVLAKGINNKLEKNKGKIRQPLNYGLAFFWGVFPDLFAFTIPFMVSVVELASGKMHFADLRPVSAGEPPQVDSSWFFRLAHYLYNFSHSFIIFGGVILIVWLIYRRFFWEMSGWLLHIIMDIPTHSYRFFPTPFLFPISSFKFSGYQWSHLWFLVADYAALIGVYLYLWRNKS